MSVFKPGCLYIGENRVLYAGTGIEAEMHEHFALSVLIALDGDFKIGRPGGSLRTCEGVIVSANVRHELKSSETRMVVLQFDPDQIDAAESELLVPGDIAPFKREQIAGILSDLEELPEGLADCERAWQIYDSVLKSLGFLRDEPPELDERIVKVIEHLREFYEEKISVGDLAELVGLSEDRLMRLFREQLGIPIRRYHLWIRLRKAATFLKDGVNLTHAAHEAGFADSAHFSRTFKNMFGVAPSAFLSNMSEVKVHFC